MSNHVNITTVVILGFPGLNKFRIPVFCILLLIYSTTIYGNVLVLVLVSCNKKLQTLMYFFLTQLTISDIMLSTCITPNTLYVTLNNGGTVPFTGCLVQFYFFFALESLDCFLLTVMAYDRYLAIGYPLHYTTMMSSRLCLVLIMMCWVVGLLIPAFLTAKIQQAEFCGNMIDHFFCDFEPIIQLFYTDTSQIQMEASFFGVPVVICPFIAIVASYAYIVATIIRMPSATGRWKAMSTCGSHLSVVVIFYGTLLAMYEFPNQDSGVVKKGLSMLYTVLIPLLNVLIYSLRNKDIKTACRKLTIGSIQLNPKGKCTGVFI